MPVVSRETELHALKILYLITRAEAGGAQAHLLEHLRGLCGHADLHLATGEEEGFLVEQSRALGVTVHRVAHLVQPLQPANDARAIGEIRALIRRVEPDLIHMHSSKAGLLGRVAARMERVPFVFTAHGWAFTDGVPLKRKAVALTSEWLAGRLGGWVIAVSEYDHRLALRYKVIPPGRITTIHNGIRDVPMSLRASFARPGARRMTMVARFAPPKDFGALLRAVADLRDLPWTLELVGDGPLLAETRALADRLALTARVSFAGACNDVPERLARAHIFVLISNYEGLPISILEAMRAGLPVVASNVGGVSEAVAEGQTGFLIPRGDVVALQQRLRRLLSDFDLMRRLGEAGRKRYEACFTVQGMLDKTQAVYEQVLGR